MAIWSTLLWIVALLDAAPAKALETVNALGGVVGFGQKVIGAPAGNYTIGAYSSLTLVAPPASPNAVVAAQTQVPIGAVPVPYVPGALTFLTGKWPFRSTWVGVGTTRAKAGAGGLAAPPAGMGVDIVQSSCPAAPPINPDSTLGLGKILVTGGGYVLFVRADVNLTGIGLGGTGVGYSVDPYTVPPGTYTYSPVLTNIALTNESDDAGATATLALTAFSSLDTNNPVWYLNLILSGNDTLEVDFASSKTFYDFQLDDDAVKSNLLAALVVSNNTVLLQPQYASTGYPLFNTTFDATNSFDFTESIGGLASVPPITPGAPAMTRRITWVYGLSLVAFGAVLLSRRPQKAKFETG